MQQAAFEGAKQNILFNDNIDNIIQQLSLASFCEAIVRGSAEIRTSASDKGMIIC